MCCMFVCIYSCMNILAKCVHKILKMNKYMPKDKFNVSYYLRGLELF